MDLNANNRQWVMLGGLFPLSVNEKEKCGMLRNSAVERVEAMVYAIQRVNKDQMLLPGVNLTFDIRDTCTIPIRALEESINYVQPNLNSILDNSTAGVAISGVLGPAISDASVLVANVLRLFQIPQISYGSTAAVLSDQSRYDYFFRTIPSDTQQVKVIASLIRHFNWTYVFALYSRDTYGTDGVNSLIEELNAGNESSVPCFAVQISLPLGALENDTVFDWAAEEMSKAWVRKASVAVLFGHSEEANGMLSAVERKVSINPTSPLSNITWIASDSWGLSLDVKFYSKARGMLAVQPVSNTIADFVEYFTNLTPNTTMNPWFDGYWESFFSCSLNGGKSPCSVETQRLPNNLTLSLQIPNIVSGVYAIASALDKMLTDFCPSGTVCDDIVVQRPNGQAIDGEKLRKYLLNVTLSGFSLFDHENRTFFDSNGDVKRSYTVYNLQFNYSNQLSFHPIATWDNINFLSIDEEDIEWKSGREVPQSVCSLPCGPSQEPVSIPNQEQCCWTCRSCLGEFSVSPGDRCYECKESFIPNTNRSGCVAISLTYFTWSNSLGILVAVLAGLGAVICVGTAVAYAMFFNHKLIKASSRELSAILLCGILFCYILPFIFLIKPTAAACAIQRIGSGVSFALVFSALLVKTNRIHRIFNRSPHQLASPPRLIGPVSQVVIACLFVLVQIVIAAIWLAIEPPRVKQVVVNRKALELICDHNPHATLVVTVLYNLILLIGSTYFAFRTRKVPENFNEARFINITLFTLCLVWLAFVPTFYVSTVELSMVYQVFFLLLTIILSASVTMCCLLMPKVFFVVLHKVQQTNDGSAQSGKKSGATMNLRRVSTGSSNDKK